MKYCSHCGHELVDDAVVCTNCGCAVYNQQNIRPNNRPIEQGNQPIDIMSIIGFVLAFIVAIAGLVVSIIAYNRVKFTDDYTSKSFAKAGIIISIVEIAIAVILVVAYVVFLLVLYINLGCVLQLM
jgi:uncharacterized membrane protein YvbJ